MNNPDLPKAEKKEIIGFCLFDFANSAYTTVIITVIYSVYFSSKIGSPAGWSMTLSVSYLFVILLSPILGAMIDDSGNKKRFLFFAMLLCSLSTALLFFGSKERYLYTVILIVLSNAGFAFSENFVSSFLPDLAEKSNMGKISGYAWGFGYIGGISSLLLCLSFLGFRNYSDTALRIVPVLTALFFFVFSIPTFLWVRERHISKTPSSITAGFNRLKATMKNIKNYNELMKFLFSFFFYTCGTATVISFAAIYAIKEIGFSQEQTIKLIISANIFSAIGAFLFGFLQDKIGCKKSLIISIFIWLLMVLLAALSKDKALFIIAANGIGFAMGASQSNSRSMIALLSPIDKTAEFYGFWGFAGKGASLVGLFSFGIILKLTGNKMDIGLYFTALFFLIGLVLLFFIKNEKA